MTPTSDPSGRRVRFAVLLTALAGALQLARFTDPAWAVDDAWISFTYAKTLLTWGELTYKGGAPPVEGMTNLLWTLLSCVWIAASDRDPLHGARLVGAACHLATLAVAVLLAARVARRLGGRPDIAGAATGAILASSGSLAFFAMSGLETPLWCLLFVTALERLDRAREGPGRVGPGLTAGALLAALAATRPEGVLLAGLLSLAALASPTLRWRGALAVALPAALGVAALEIFRLAWFGSLVPNTFHAKPGVLSEGLTYVGAFALYGTGLVGVLAAGPTLRREPAARVLAVILAVVCAGAAWSGGDWMPGSRRLAEVVLGGGLLCGVGLSLAEGRWRALAAAGVAAWLVAAGVAWATGWDSARQVPLEAREIAEAATASPDVRMVAMADIGRFGYFFEGDVLDLVGLTDAQVAHRPGKHGAKEWDEAWFRSLQPDLVLARSDDPVVDPLPAQPRIGTTEHAIVRSILDGGGYRYHGTFDLGLERGRYWLLFRKDDVRLDPALWGPPPDKDLRELLIELEGRAAR